MVLSCLYVVAIMEKGSWKLSNVASASSWSCSILSFEDPLCCFPQDIQKSSLILRDSRDNTVDAPLKQNMKHNIRHILFVHHQELA